MMRNYICYPALRNVLAAAETTLLIRRGGRGGGEVEKVVGGERTTDARNAKIKD